MPRRLLILGGTAEAAELASRTAATFGDRLVVISSLAGRLPPSQGMTERTKGELRRGGFGGADGLARYLGETAIDLVIDATHPFAATIARHADEACRRVGIPRLLLIRPPWMPAAGDRWIEAADMRAAARLLPALGRRAFLTVGPGGLAAFADLADVWLLVRLFAPPPSPLPLAAYQVVVARPPFPLPAEIELMAGHAIEVLVSKQSGGPLEAKLRAARTLGLPVLMIKRPPKPAGEVVSSVDAALAWVGQRLAQVKC